MLQQEDQQYDEFEPLIREHTVADQHFIMKTWLRVIAYDFTRTSKDRFYNKQSQVIRNIMKDSRSRCAILCDAAAQDYIVGFMIGEEAPIGASRPMVVHFTFVRQAYRKQGLCKEMLKSLAWYPGRPILATQWARDLYSLKGHLNFEYDPFILQGIREPSEERHPNDTSGL